MRFFVRLVTTTLLVVSFGVSLHAKERPQATTTTAASPRSHDVSSIADAVRQSVLQALPPERLNAIAAKSPTGPAPRIGTIERQGNHVRITGDPLLPSRRSVVQVQGLQAADEQVAVELLDSLATELRLFSPREEYFLQARTEDSAGNTHLRFQQQLKGLPVVDHQAIIHLNPEGAPVAVTGSVLPTPRRVRTEPTVSLERARAAVEGEQWTIEDGGRLVIHGEGRRSPRLAWELVRSNGLYRESIFVDAHQGQIVEKRSLVRSSGVQGGGTDVFGVYRELSVWPQSGGYFLIDTSKPMWSSGLGSPRSHERGDHGVIALSDHSAPYSGSYFLRDIYSSTPNDFGPPEAVSAAYLLSKLYDFYSQRFGQNSFDGEGKSIIGLVRVLEDNAFWNGAVIGLGYPNRYAGAADVVAHEYAHAVVESSANLKYESESGALNEAFADVLGQAFEAWLTGTPDWEVGEDLGTPARSFSHPESYGQPSKMSDFRSLPLSQDNGGVHINGGILNHAYYQMAVAVPGAIGVERASDIYYHALVNHLRPTSDFADAAAALIDSAVERYGSNSAEHKAVLEALRRVELFETEEEEEPPVYTPVNATDSFLFAFQNDEGWFLGRSEAGLGDPAEGVSLSVGQIAPATRISVTGDGSLVFFVSADFDACFIATSGEEPEECLGVAGTIGSVAMSPDGTRYGLILLDESGNLTNQLVYLDLVTEVERHLTLPAPVIDGALSAEIQAADSLSFNLSGTSLYYDAFTEIEVGDEVKNGTWSIYEYVPASNLVFNIVPPTRGLDFGYPGSSRTSEQYLTFDVYDLEDEKSSVFVADLLNHEFGFIYSTPDHGIPSFTGEDATLIFSYPSDSPSGYSLAEIPLAPNRLSPTANATFIIHDSDMGATYRRGTFSGPSTEPGQIEFSSVNYGGREGSSTVVSVKRVGGRKGRLEARYDVVGGSAKAGSDYQITGSTVFWEDGDDRDQRITITALTDGTSEGNETIVIRLTGLNGARVGSIAQTTITIEDYATAPVAPSNLRTADATGSEVTLLWTDNSNNEQEFVLYYSFDGKNFESFHTIPQNGTSVRVTELSSDTAYHFRVTARNEEGESAPSNTVVVNEDSNRRRAVRRR